MTHEQTTPTPVEVTQADREAAQALMDRWEFGDLHCDDFVEAFARHRIAHSAPAGEVVLDAYDEGLLADYGGGNVDWWQDYIRAVLGRAHEFYQTQVNDTYAAPAHPAPPADLVELVEAARASIEGWNNVVEMDLLPPQHHDTARELSKRLYAALAAMMGGAK